MVSYRRIKFYYGALSDYSANASGCGNVIFNNGIGINVGLAILILALQEAIWYYFKSDLFRYGN